MTEPGPMDRDGLARQRTTLANERTLLAYVRTSIMLAASGVTLLKIGDATGYDRPLATVLVAIAAVVLGLGVRHFRRVARVVERTD